MPTSRNMLAIGKMPEFIAFCQSKGWKVEPVRAVVGNHEVLRMRNLDFKAPMIVHTTANAKEHYTVSGNSYKMARQFIRVGYGMPENDLNDAVGDPVICGGCNGSGEGSYDGSVCYTCRGKGEI